MTFPARFRQEDLTRAVRGMEKAGMRVGSIQIDPNGRIIILPDSAGAVQGPRNEWDDDL